VTKVTYHLDLAPNKKPFKNIITTDIFRRARAVVSLLGLFSAVCLGFGNPPGTVHLLEGKFKEGGRAREQREGVT